MRRIKCAEQGVHLIVIPWARPESGFTRLFEQVALSLVRERPRRYSDEFRRDAVGIATTSGLTRPQVSSDLGVGLSTLNKWVQKHQHDDLMSGPHDDVEKENTRLRKEVRLLKEREVLKKLPSSLQAKTDEICIHRSLERRMASRISLQNHAGYIAWLSSVACTSNKPATAGRRGDSSTHSRTAPP